MYEKGNLLSEGKTKKIWELKGSDELAIIETKNAITAFDDPAHTREFKTKAIFSTTTTCRVFELLERAGIPVAYKEQISPTEFLAKKCGIMLPLEVVARRFAVGSYLKRHPHIEKIHRFHRLVTEFFLKTTKGKLIDHYGNIVLEGLDPQKGEEDPLIMNPLEENWKLFHSKKPFWDPQANLNKEIEARAFPMLINQMESILREVFLVLEGAWNTLGLRLVDMKIEFGYDNENTLLVADVIDNDSWRLRDAQWQELSKEAFRQGEKLNEVERKYGTVAALVERFRVPKQALVLWTGSTKDQFPEVFVPKDYGVDVVKITLSGHKSPQACLEKLEKIMANYPDGGVIVVKVGRSNGLGPMIAARTSWPVICIPATLKDFPHDLWSSIRMPSSTPLTTAWPEKNAILMAQNILSAKNPLIYMLRQKEIEKLDM